MIEIQPRDRDIVKELAVVAALDTWVCKYLSFLLLPQAFNFKMQYNRKGAIVYSAVKARNPIHGLTAIARPYMYKNQTWDFHNNYISPSDIQTKKFVAR